MPTSLKAGARKGLVKGLLVTAMKSIADDALAHYLDAVVEPLGLTRFSRGMVSTARGKIRTIAYSGIEKGLSRMSWRYRQPVVRYFQDMLTGAEVRDERFPG